MADEPVAEEVFEEIIDAIMVYHKKVDSLVKAIMGQNPRELDPNILIATMDVMGADLDMSALATQMKARYPKEFGL